MKTQDRNEPDTRMFSRRYPWEEWFAQGKFTVYRDVDFNGMLYTMAQQVRNAANRLGCRVNIKLDESEGSITVVVYRLRGRSKK